MDISVGETAGARAWEAAFALLEDGVSCDRLHNHLDVLSWKVDGRCCRRVRAASRTQRLLEDSAAELPSGEIETSIMIHMCIRRS